MISLFIYKKVGLCFICVMIRTLTYMYEKSQSCCIYVVIHRLTYTQHAFEKSMCLLLHIIMFLFCCICDLKYAMTGMPTYGQRYLLLWFLVLNATDHFLSENSFELSKISENITKTVRFEIPSYEVYRLTAVKNRNSKFQVMKSIDLLQSRIENMICVRFPIISV